MTERRWRGGRILILGLLAVGCAFPFSCAPARYRASADRETYQIIQEKTAAVPGAPEDFSIESEPAGSEGEDLLAGLPRVTEAETFLGADGGGEQGAAILSLEQALRVAVHKNRTYQNQKESLYLEFLSLTLERHNYTPIFSASAEGAYDSTADLTTGASAFSQGMTSADTIIGQVESITGTPAALLQSYADLASAAGTAAGWYNPETSIDHTGQVSARSSMGVDLLMKGGGRLALGLTSNFLRFVSGDSGVATNSVLTGSFSQPLWRGAGAKIAAERLTQAERDALYALRSFTRYRKQFSVTICSAYYGVLESREVARNSWQSYQSFLQNVARVRSFVEEGQQTQTELGRLEQAQFNTENSWTNAVRRYREALDEFKLQLGLSTDAAVVLDPKELDLLRQDGIKHPDMSGEDVVKVALAARLDLYSDRDRVADAERRVKVAVNDLKPGLDLLAGGQVPSTGQDNFQELDFRRFEWNAGLDVDLPLDQKAERNAYRSALIAFERAKRDGSLAEDQVKLEVRAAWRDLDQAKRNYEVALKSVELNERRVEEQDLLAELGRATALDQVDAQNDLTSARNDLISALVNHTISRLSLWRDMGILYIKDNGKWEEVTDGQS